MQDVVKTTEAGDLHKLRAMIAADQELVIGTRDRVSDLRCCGYGVNVTQGDKNALILAAKAGHTELVKELIATGVDKDHKCKVDAYSDGNGLMLTFSAGALPRTMPHDWDISGLLDNSSKPKQTSTNRTWCAH